MRGLLRTLASGRFRARRRERIGPSWAHVFWNVSYSSGNGRPRVTSWGYSLFGRVTRNVTRETTTVDTPGPGAVTFRDAR